MCSTIETFSPYLKICDFFSENNERISFFNMGKLKRPYLQSILLICNFDSITISYI